MRNLIALLFLFVFGQAFGQITEVRRVTQTLCSPEFHGRGYYQKGDSIAAAFLVNEFKALGLKPVQKKSFLQSYTLEGVNVFNGKMLVEANGSLLQPGVDYMVDPSSGGGTFELKPFYVSVETALDEQAFAAALAEYKQSHTYNALLFDFAGAKGDTAKALKGISAAFAAYLPVIETTSDKFTWSVGREAFAFPLIYIQSSALDAPIETLQLKIDQQFIEKYRTQNVVARIPAKKKCAKTIVFSAHYDHLGRMGDSTYFPGANDNASGTAMLLSMARYFKEHPSEYNIVFIAFSGEEAGLVGSKYFVEHPLLPLKDITFLINLDIMGSGEEGITVVNATLFPNEFESLKSISDSNQLLAQVKQRGPAANSDHYWFTEAGVPAFFIYTMGPNKHYHDVFDRYDELSFNEYEDITSLLVRFVEELSKR